MKIFLRSQQMYNVGVNPFRQEGMLLKWFVCLTNSDQKIETLYLHRDGSTHTYCGSRGFFQTESDAQIAVAMLVRKQEPVLPKELFEI